MLTQSAYADDRHLRSRMAIYRYAEVPADPGWRISPVAWDGTQVVADFGCGNGFDLRQLVPGGRCRHAFGLDLSSGMLRTLEEMARSSGRLTLIQADAQRLPLRDGGVDVALAMHMLYHVPDVPAAVAELRRIVKPGGILLASTNSERGMAEVNDLFGAAVAGARRRGHSRAGHVPGRQPQRRVRLPLMASVQLEIPGHRVDAVVVIGADGQAGSGGGAAELGETTIGNEVDQHAGFDGLVVDSQEVGLRPHLDGDLAQAAF